MKLDNTKIIGIIVFIIGVLLIGFSDAIPIPSILIYITGALLVAHGVLSFLR